MQENNFQTKGEKIMLLSTALLFLCTVFAFNWNKERERNERILKSLPENIRSIYLR